MVAEKPRTYLEHLLAGSFSRIEKDTEQAISSYFKDIVLSNMYLLEQIFKYYPIFYSFQISGTFSETDNIIYAMWQSKDGRTALDIGFDPDSTFDVGFSVENKEERTAKFTDMVDVLRIFFQFILDTYLMEEKTA